MATSTATRMTEISFEVPADEVAVLDGSCSAKGVKRTTVIRRLLREWSAEIHHVSTVVCRVAGSKPATPDTDRDEFGAAGDRQGIDL